MRFALNHMTLSRPNRSFSPWVTCALVLVAVILQVLLVVRFVGVYDESLELFDAEHVMRGAIPYRDFWTMYGPAQFYLLGSFFKVFGTSVLTARVYDALVRTGLAYTCFVLVSRFTSRGIAFVVFCAAVWWPLCNGYVMFNFPVYPAFLLSLLSIFLLAGYIRDVANSRYLFFAGMLVGLTACFRHDSGFYIALCESIAFVWFTVIRPRIPFRQACRQSWRPGLLYFAGILIVAAPVAIFLLTKVPVHDLFYQLFYVPAKVYPKVRHVPFPGIRALLILLRSGFRWRMRISEGGAWIVAVPVFTFALGVAALAFPKVGRKQVFETDDQQFTFGLLVLFCSVLYVKGWVRMSPPQQLQSILGAFMVLAILFGSWNSLPRFLKSSLLSSTWFLALCLLSPLSVARDAIKANMDDLLNPSSVSSFHNTCHPPLGLERARCFSVNPDDVLTVQYIEQHTSPSDRIYIGAGRHDKLFWSNVSLYFLSDRSSVTKWYDLHPGVQTTLPIQNEIVQSLRTYSPKLIVLDAAMDNMQEPNESSIPSGVTVLDEYIATNYGTVATFGTKRILAATPR